MNEELLSRLKNIEEMIQGYTPKEYMTIEEAAEYTTFKVSTLRGYVQRKQIPFARKGGKIIFKRESLSKWLDEGLHVPVTGDRISGNKVLKFRL